MIMQLSVVLLQWWRPFPNNACIVKQACKGLLSVLKHIVTLLWDAEITALRFLRWKSKVEKRPIRSFVLLALDRIIPGAMLSPETDPV